MSFNSNMKAVMRNIRKFYRNPFFRAKFLFTKYYEENEVKNNEFLIQCYSGTGISCNPYYIMEELCTNEAYHDMKIYLGVNAKVYDEVIDYIHEKHFSNVEVIMMHGKKYCRKLAECKYLVNNVTFPTYFIKKKEQVYLNTWHGTPLKALGKSMTEEMHTIGNVQRNFRMSDYIIAPNQFTLDVLRNDYMLNNFYDGKYLLCGYPRNHIFYDIEKQKQIRQELELEGKKIVAYMPTWRGTHALRNDKDQYIYTMHMLIELEKNLDEDVLIFVKEHNMSTLEINFDEFTNVKPFPKNFETYEFLSIADTLITDYSSVMFDYANTGRKIILYAYDKKQYLKDRGMYMEYDELPFTIVYTSRELIHEVQHLNKFDDYKEKIHSLIAYDEKNTISDLLNLMVNGEKGELNVISGETYGNHKKNVLIFTGALLRNGITTALKGILNNLDKEKKNYVLTFMQKAVSPNHEVLHELGDFDYIGVQGQKNFRINEVLAYFLYYRLNISNRYVETKLKKIYTREAMRVYYGLEFEYVIHYTGYERQFMNLFRFMDAKRITYVHNNLIAEYKTRGNVHLPTVKAAYREFEEIAIIRESMKDELIGDLNNIGERVHVAHNLNNYEDIQKKSLLPVALDEKTECTHTLEELNFILDDEKNTIFINIARFSKEKGLDNLVSAFEQYYTNGNDDTYLIIIGGHGATYNELMKQIDVCKSKDHIVIIKSISNPYSILGKSDVFILSSHYEGLPMVIMEALILGKPVISTNITGPKEFLEQGYGHLVDDSVEGLVSGMDEYKATKLAYLKPFDYVAFNKKALAEFEGLFE